MSPEDADETPDEAIIAARVAVTATRAPRPLSAAEAGQVRERVASRVRAAATLRAVPLANADEPEIVFVPFRHVGGAGEGSRA